MNPSRFHVTAIVLSLLSVGALFVVTSAPTAKSDVAPAKTDATKFEPKRIEVALKVGDRVWMPRGILHTFMSGPDGLLVDSIHNPFVGLEGPHCLIYPENSKG